MAEIHLFRNSSDALVVPIGAVLFHEGESGDDLIAVVEGQIDLHQGGNFIEAVCSGGILGEMALIDSAPRSATATAACESRIVRVSRNDFTYLVHEHPTFALQVMQVMSARLRRRDHQHG